MGLTVAGFIGGMLLEVHNQAQAKPMRDLNELTPQEIWESGAGPLPGDEYDAGMVFHRGMELGSVGYGLGALNAGVIAPGIDRAKGTISGFAPQESAIINETRQILSSSQMNQLRAAHAAGEGTIVKVGDRWIQYEPNWPGMSGFTDFENNSFVLGPEAFASETELTKTTLHELYRLSTSDLATTAEQYGSFQDAVSAETQAAFEFAERAFDAVFRQ